MKLIQTDSILSTIHSRTAIFIDNVICQHRKASVLLKGTIMPEAMGYDAQPIFTFEMTFVGVLAFEAMSLDNSKLDSQMLSNFNMIADSQLIQDPQSQKTVHYVLSTYDYVYQIVAKEYTLKINDKIFI